MTRNSWNGSISAGMFCVPVTLASAVSTSGGIELHQYAPDGGRIRYKRVSEKSGEEVPYADIRMGYEAPDGTLAYLTDDDFAEAYGTVSRNARVIMFTDPAHIPDVARCRPFIVAPARATGRKAKGYDTGSVRAYALLADALRSTGKVGIVTFGLRERKRLAVLSEQDGYLILEQLEWAEDLAAPEFEAPSADLSGQEREAARALVGSMAGDFTHTDYEDDSRAKVNAMIEARITAGKPAGAPEADGNVAAFGSLLDAIRASIDAAKPPVKASA